MIFSQLVEAFQECIIKANDSLSQENLNVLNTYFDADDEQENLKDNIGIPTRLKPKTVEMEFPYITELGMEKSYVQVPLIALTPIKVPEISELRISLNLEISLEDNELKVEFPNRNESHQKESTKVPSNLCSVDIVLQPTTGPEGLKNLIQGYEKSLRSQIP